MHIGLMEGTIRRDSVAETLDATVHQRIYHLQYHVSSEISVVDVKNEMDARDIQIVALSGTYNMIDPDIEKRKSGLR
ncbi:hypothetical protein JT359_20030, partial [Candidatus Poribacteria bacterium]|nr:hypothetical protein [Candidatus Poribacteria bacterium]